MNRHRYGKLFLLDRSNVVIVRDADGVQVSFNSVEEFSRHWPGLDLTGKTYINYEPERRPIATYIDDADPEITAKDIPNAEYEAVIAAAHDLLAQKNDSYFGMELTSAKALRVKEVQREAKAIVGAKWPLFKQINCLAGIYDEETKVEMVADVKSIIAAVGVAELAIEAAKEVDEVKTVKVQISLEAQREDTVSR